MDVQAVMEGLDALFADRQTGKIEDYLSVHLETALKEGDVGCAITIINELIGFYRDTSQYDKAEAYCEKLLPFMERAGLKDTVHYGTSCLNIANAYRASGRLEDSLAHYKMVSDIYEKVLEPKDIHYASLNNNLSLLYQEMGRFDKASEALLAALEIVKGYPDARVELGVTYSNLAASYVKLGKLDRAEEAAASAVAVFQDGLQEDYHCTGALAGAGDVYLARAENIAVQRGREDGDAQEYYAEAVQFYEKAMLLLKSHVGMTHAYFRIASKLQTSWEHMGYEGALKGLKICENYYYVTARHVLEVLGEEIGHKRLLEEITVGKVGEGSECFGYDDLLSIDHDFGPGFCIFVTRQQYREFGAKLEEAYNHPDIPKTYCGFERPPVIRDKPRNGVIVIEDFMKRILGLSEEEVAYMMERHTLPDGVFLRLSDWQLKTVTNGALFHPDAKGMDLDGMIQESIKLKNMEMPIFEEIYHHLKRGYPEPVRRKKIAQMLGEMSQSGQYNYKRMMLRGDRAAARRMINDFVNAGIHLLYLLNHEYAPHSKWLFAGTGDLLKGQEIAVQLRDLFELPVLTHTYESRPMMEWIGTTNRDDPVPALVDAIAAGFVGLMKEEGLTEGDFLYLEDHITEILNAGQEV